MCSEAAAAQKHIKLLHESMDNQAELAKGKRLLSSECRESGYISSKKPEFNKVNVLGNMNQKHQFKTQSSQSPQQRIPRTYSSGGGPNLRPAIVCATGGAGMAYQSGAFELNSSSDDCKSDDREVKLCQNQLALYRNRSRPTTSN